MRKILAMLLAVVMVLGLCACGGNSAAPAETTAAATEAPAAAENADDVPDEMTSSDGKYEIAFVTDVGQLKDKSFNQGTFDGVKLYAANAGKSYKYYQPAGGDQATDDDRYDAMKLAVENGAKVLSVQVSCRALHCRRLLRNSPIPALSSLTAGHWA